MKQPEVDYKLESWQLNEDQRLKSVLELKNEGNKLVKAGKWGEAAKQYREAIGR